jgi:hypothetical protein
MPLPGALRDDDGTTERLGGTGPAASNDGDHNVHAALTIKA